MKEIGSPYFSMTTSIRVVWLKNLPGKECSVLHLQRVVEGLREIIYFYYVVIFAKWVSQNWVSGMGGNHGPHESFIDELNENEADHGDVDDQEEQEQRGVGGGGGGRGRGGGGLMMRRRRRRGEEEEEEEEEGGGGGERGGRYCLLW